MSIEIGTIVEGKVSGISKFGAFVDLPDGSTGMVHISEVSQSYVSEIKDFLSIGDTVKVKVLSLENGKIVLSIKQTQPKPDKKNRNDKNSASYKSKPRKPYKPAPPVTSPGSFEWQSSRPDSPSSFEDMMSMFKKTSEDKMSDLKRSSGESRGYSRRGNGSRK
ncbi:MAG: S1 RNA-binding domain-containing protein [Ruminococcus sp.]|nr:S1 RNA-binding domain-containing protein [Ruminococcus sp.]